MIEWALRAGSSKFECMDRCIFVTQPRFDENENIFLFGHYVNFPMNKFPIANCNEVPMLFYKFAAWNLSAFPNSFRLITSPSAKSPKYIPEDS
jgi:hypothetical protein